MTEVPVPRATYRLQLHKDFPFAAAAEVAPYLARLGISHAYLSPILAARAGSRHDYDVVDHARLNPELGTEADFRAMAAAFRRHGLGILVDIVPNHMAVGGADNPLWLDVLERGEASRYAAWFDIDWHPPTPGLDGKLLVPFLGTSYGEALQDGSLSLRFDAGDGKLAIWAHKHHKLPLSPETAAGLAVTDVPRLNADKAALDALIARQHWRIARSSVGDDEVNYRRFFIVSDLAGIRIERPDVFAHVHRLIFALIAERLVDGLRIDHVDGLYDPRAYCQQLRAEAPRPVYIVAEKILAASEALPTDWGIEGTTGYDFAAQVTPLLVDPASEAALTRFHREFTGVTDAFVEVERAAKLRVMDHELAAELAALSWRFARLAAADAATRDLTRRRLQAALRGVVAAMPVYRTYITAEGASTSDRGVIAAALADAARQSPELDAAALAFIGEVLAGADRRAAALDLAMRVQQFTGPVMAKGLEDTALYRDSRLIALNDVGERPDRFSLDIADFHAAASARAAALPHAMLATSTHDSKRGEDARCRIATLSGHADEWMAEVPRWLAAIRKAGAPAIDPDDAYQFFQLLLGAWPGATSLDLADRLVGALRKSLREARLRSSWIELDHEYESRVESFVRLALDPVRGREFLNRFATFEATIGLDGAVNGLIETTLKLTLPGVPDIYQGADLWEQSMVDPDNRRAVDLPLRARLLQDGADAPLADLLEHWRDGAVKQALIARLLAVRAAHPSLFASGSFERLDVDGPAAQRIYAFLRRHAGTTLLVAVRLYPWRGADDDPWPLTGALEGAGWRDVLGCMAHTGPLFTALPLAVLLSGPAADDLTAGKT